MGIEELFSHESFFQQCRHPVAFEIIPPSVDTEHGHDRRGDKSQSQGGMPVNENSSWAMEAIKNDTLEEAVGQAKGLRAKGEELFGVVNKE